MHVSSSVVPRFRETTIIPKITGSKSTSQNLFPSLFIFCDWVYECALCAYIFRTEAMLQRQVISNLSLGFFSCFVLSPLTLFSHSISFACPIFQHSSISFSKCSHFGWWPRLHHDSWGSVRLRQLVIQPTNSRCGNRGSMVVTVAVTARDWSKHFQRCCTEKCDACLCTNQSMTSTDGKKIYFEVSCYPYIAKDKLIPARSCSGKSESIQFAYDIYIYNMYWYGTEPISSEGALALVVDTVQVRGFLMFRLYYSPLDLKPYTFSEP